jgi:hypothetical protein
MRKDNYSGILRCGVRDYGVLDFGCAVYTSRCRLDPKMGRCIRQRLPKRPVDRRFRMQDRQPEKDTPPSAFEAICRPSKRRGW